MHSITLKLTAMTAIAHQDASPQANNGSNMKPFNRSLGKIKAEVGGVLPEDAVKSIGRVTQYFPIYPSVAQLLDCATGGELLAALFIAQYPLHFGSREGGEGEGLFSGISRYEMLSKKLQDAATYNLRLSGLYQALTELLCLSNYYPESQLIFSTLPNTVQSAISVACLKNPQFVVALARQVAEAGKDDRRKERKNQLEELGIYQPTKDQIKSLSQAKSDSLIVALPDLSGNSIGHQLRSAISLDLIERLELKPEEIPTGSAYLMFHGGQRSKGVKTPGDSDLLEAKIRANYPGLDAMGGCPDAFLMTEGRLKLQAHILCSENAWITEAVAGISENKSVFQMLDFVTMTRSGMGGNDSESGQMIFAHEVLCKGTEAVLKLTFLPNTKPETIGAVLSGLNYWTKSEGKFGGKSSRNFGRFAIAELASNYPDAAFTAYEQLLMNNKSTLIEGIKDGSFCSGKVVCNAGLGEFA